MAPLRGTELVYNTHKHTNYAPPNLGVSMELGLLQHYTTYLNYSITESPLSVKTPTHHEALLYAAAVRRRIASRNGPRKRSPTRDRGERYRFPRLNTSMASPRVATKAPTPRNLSAKQFEMMATMELPKWKQEYMVSVRARKFTQQLLLRLWSSLAGCMLPPEKTGILYLADYW